MSTRTLNAQEFGDLLAVLESEGFTIVAPTVGNGAVEHRTVRDVADLPVGVADEQGPASYRLAERQDRAWFGYAVGPHSWKRLLYPPTEVVWSGTLKNGGVVHGELPQAPMYAFVGVRPCDVAAMKIQDTVLGADPGYSRRREAALVVAVNCTSPAATCFCTSMGTGPFADDGFDLVLTEITEGEHRFVFEAGSDRGEAILELLPAGEVTDPGVVEALRDASVAAISKRLETRGLAAFLAANLDHRNWDDVAKRCFACGNCTLVCPTCFCSGFDDALSLDGTTATRTRRWDSCFGLDYSYIHGGPVRREVSSRYRQWMTHKLSSWHSQFGTSGCVGCGRCVTWCPAAIDITAEVAVMRRSEDAVH